MRPEKKKQGKKEETLLSHDNIKEAPEPEQNI
jgi:hypothetical protein